MLPSITWPSPCTSNTSLYLKVWIGCQWISKMTNITVPYFTWQYSLLATGEPDCDCHLIAVWCGSDKKTTWSGLGKHCGLAENYDHETVTCVTLLENIPSVASQNSSPLPFILDRNSNHPFFISSLCRLVTLYYYFYHWLPPLLP